MIEVSCVRSTVSSLVRKIGHDIALAIEKAESAYTRTRSTELTPYRYPFISYEESGETDEEKYRFHFTEYMRNIRRIKFLFDLSPFTI